MYCPPLLDEVQKHVYRRRWCGTQPGEDRYLYCRMYTPPVEHMLLQHTFLFLVNSRQPMFCSSLPHKSNYILRGGQPFINLTVNRQRRDQRTWSHKKLRQNVSYATTVPPPPPVSQWHIQRDRHCGLHHTAGLLLVQAHIGRKASHIYLLRLTVSQIIATQLLLQRLSWSTSVVSNPG